MHNENKVNGTLYVLLNKDDYYNKLNEILNDTTKFKSIKTDPTPGLKVKLNKLIKQINNHIDDDLPTLVGEYQPGYLYGNVKTHKNNNPLRPIISQIPTVTYPVAKFLNKTLSPYIPCKYYLQSSREFINILTTNKPLNHIASLDVESLFTNVPIHETINIIINTVYHSDMNPPKNPETLIKTYRQTLQTNRRGSNGIPSWCLIC